MTDDDNLEPTGDLLRAVLDLIDQRVDAISDEEVEARLQAALHTTHALVAQ